MNFTESLIYPPIKLKPLSASKIRVSILDMKIFEYVRVSVHLLDIDDSIIDSKIYILEGDDYKGWGTDDNYLINWVKKQLNNECQNN